MTQKDARYKQQKHPTRRGNPPFFVSSAVFSPLFFCPVAAFLRPFSGICRFRRFFCCLQRPTYHALSSGLTCAHAPCRADQPRPQKKSTPPPQTFGVFLTLLCNPRACAKGKQIYGPGAKRGKRLLQAMQPVANDCRPIAHFFAKILGIIYLIF